ncbi:MAG: TRAP transporter TatT component family protein [Pseudomonadota bacterium]
MRTPALPRSAWLGVLLTVALTGCVKKVALRSLADTFASSSSSSFGQDEDLQLVGDAVPFALKLMESLAAEVPDHRGLRLSLASGFTQYAMVWVLWPAEQEKYGDFAAYRAGVQRARAMLLRARGYAFEGMDMVHPGFSEGILTDPEAALAACTAADVPYLYWLGASWLAAISSSREDPEMIGQIPTVADILHRAEALDEAWDRGSIHEVLISLEPVLPGPDGPARAKAHFDRAMELNGGARAGPFVSLATATTVDAQDRERFEALLGQALAVDVEQSPPDRLANAYAREQAQFLLSHADDLFI